MSIEELVTEIQAGNTGAKNELWERLHRWVYKLCLKYKLYAEGKGYELDDLISWAWFGVERAISKYTPKKGYKFITITKYHIINTIREGLGLRGHQKEPFTLSLDEPIPNGEDEDTTHLDMLEDESAAVPFEDAEDRAQAEWLWSRVDKLDERRAYVLRAHYKDGAPFIEIGKYLGVAGSRAAQLKNEALRALRKDEELREYYNEFAYIHVGVKSFNSTWTSATELAAIKLEELRAERLKGAWKE